MAKRLKGNDGEAMAGKAMAKDEWWNGKSHTIKRKKTFRKSTEWNRRVPHFECTEYRRAGEVVRPEKTIFQLHKIIFHYQVLVYDLGIQIFIIINKYSNLAEDREFVRRIVLRFWPAHGLVTSLHRSSDKLQSWLFNLRVPLRERTKNTTHRTLRVGYFGNDSARDSCLTLLDLGKLDSLQGSLDSQRIIVEYFRIGEKKLRTL